MSLNALIITTLNPTEVPVAFQAYRGNESTYITYFSVVDVPVLHADDELKETEDTMQIDIWSKGDYTKLVAQVKQLMKDAGFLYSSGREMYEPDTGIYHYAITYRYSVKVS